ncbi:hypothetical protein [Caballeronia sp. LZ035]|uniref:hypothetical protein n=1 Tax=Caballeronia sp. LZ035 TaxID=3038568 RepID=UPI00285A22D1|nr:hypothetical protein [Caballeronia sp. LZ035]MDR5761461.1 hypothetical protein [Caballeronia sp. LZ035]
MDKREAQLKLWTRTDTDIVALISTLACSLTCWECLIECRLCPLICDIRNLENRLHGTGGLTHEVYSLYDLNNWQLRNQTIRKDVFERIRDVLRAWETPAQTIDKALADNSKLYGEIQLSIAKEPAGALVDLVTRLVPKHIAIGPRDASGKVSTGIDVRFIDLCGCDTCVPDNCCGPDVGRVPVLMEITGPQPYLIEPDKLFDVMCCLVTERYEPAKQALAQADSAVAASKAEIDKAIADIASKKNSLTADFLFGLENPVDCRNYHPKTPACNGAPAPADPPCNCTKHDSDNPAPPR